jgi:hypothetical protein
MCSYHPVVLNHPQGGGYQKCQLALLSIDDEKEGKVKSTSKNFP